MARITSKSRSAAAWAKLVAEWRRSGQSAADFAADHELRPKTLQWWRWRLAQRDKMRRASSPEPRLVAVDVTSNIERDKQPAVAWELEAPSGLVLRVSRVIAGYELERVLVAMGSPRNAP